MTTEKNRNIQNENKTIFYMIEDYCEQHHQSKEELCAECKELLDYAYMRISKCPHGENKPNCADCKIHCYKPELRQKIVSVMRFSGPRMMYKHPVLAAKHMTKALKHKKG